MAMVDTFDAMLSDRPYRKGMPLDVVRVLGEIKKHPNKLKLAKSRSSSSTRNFDSTLRAAESALEAELVNIRGKCRKAHGLRDYDTFH